MMIMMDMMIMMIIYDHDDHLYEKWNLFVSYLFWDDFDDGGVWDSYVASSSQLDCHHYHHEIIITI